MSKATIPAEVTSAIANLASGDLSTHGEAYEFLLLATEDSARWADAACAEIAPLMKHKDGRVRSIAGQMLCALSPNASRKTVAAALDDLMAATHDKAFVTARHVLLALWRVGKADTQLRSKLVKRLRARFVESSREKNSTLIRYDIACVLRRLFDETGDAAVKSTTLALIELEPDAKYRKKYAGAWKGA